MFGLAGAPSRRRAGRFSARVLPAVLPAEHSGGHFCSDLRTSARGNLKHARACCGSSRISVTGSIARHASARPRAHLHREPAPDRAYVEPAGSAVTLLPLYTTSDRAPRTTAVVISTAVRSASSGLVQRIHRTVERPPTPRRGDHASARSPAPPTVPTAGPQTSRDLGGPFAALGTAPVGSPVAHERVIAGSESLYISNWRRLPTITPASRCLRRHRTSSPFQQATQHLPSRSAWLDPRHGALSLTSTNWNTYPSPLAEPEAGHVVEAKASPSALFLPTPGQVLESQVAEGPDCPDRTTPTSSTFGTAVIGAPALMPPDADS